VSPPGPSPVLRRLARWRVPVGFVAGLAALWLARPTAGTLAAGAAIAAVGEALRIWAAGHLEKSREVTRSGPYRFLRHPLYVGSTLMAIGFAVAAHDLGVALLAAFYVGLMFGVAVRAENAFLRERFGAEYEAWRSGAGPAVPRRFSLERAVRNREYRAVIGLLVALALLWLKKGAWPLLHLT